jgi:glutaryl-CoA dehydrogenase
MPLPPADFFLIDSTLTESERMVRATARRFVDERVRPLIRDCWRVGRFPVEIVPELGALGFLDAEMQGATPVEHGLIMQELERGDSGVRNFASVQGGLVMFPIERYGSEEQKGRWLPLLREGKAIGCFGLTEPDFGSNPAGMRTRAERTREGWKITGEKTWITNGSIADVAVVWARTEEGIRGFLAERGAFQSADIHGKWSMRASGHVPSVVQRFAGGGVTWCTRPEGGFGMPHRVALRRWVGRYWRGARVLPDGPRVFCCPETV